MNSKTKAAVVATIVKSTVISGLMTIAASSAYATTYTYDIVGDINAPLQSGPLNLGQLFNTYFHMNINRGDLLLTYDDNGTFGEGDDFATIRGTTSGCISGSGGGCGGSMNGTASQPFGIHYGSGQFAWDIKMNNLIAEKSDGPDKFTFNMQADAGTIKLLGTTGAYKDQLGGPGDPTATVGLKNDKDFAFAINGDTGEGWLALMGGFLGQGGVRFEFGANNNFANWSFRLIPHGSGNGNPPPGEVPEPASLALLATGIAGLVRKRGKLAQ